MNPKTLLIVDDLPAIHEMLSALFTNCGYQLLFASNGLDAIRLVQENAIDVVLMDVSMQPVDGITALSDIKSIDPTIEVIIMTGYASVETERRARSLDAFAYLRKPFKVEETLQVVVDAFSQRSLAWNLASSPEQSAKLKTMKWQVLALQKEVFVLSSEIEKFSSESPGIKFSTLSDVLNGTKNLWLKFRQALRKTPLAGVNRSQIEPLPQDSPSSNARSTDNPASPELAREVLENLVAAFIHRFKNECVAAKKNLNDIRRLTDDLNDPLASELVASADQSLRSFRSITYMLNRFSNVMGRHPGILKRINIHELLFDLKAFFDPDSPDQIVLELDSPPFLVLGDRELLWHLFENLVRNGLEAVKNSSPGRVIIKAHHGPPNMGKITIQDNGNGIPPDNLNRLYDPDFSTKPRGLGVGLYIARRAVMIHKGKIDCVSTTGKGTEFHVWLPLKNT